MKVRATEELYVYPDITVVCGERQFDDDEKDVLLNPTLIVEVLSPTTEAWGSVVSTTMASGAGRSGE